MRTSGNMRVATTCLLAVTGLGLMHWIGGCAASSRQAFDYPEARRCDQVDTFHGVEVVDPYRWMEDLDSEETRAWIKAQNEITFDYLDDIPERDWIRERITQLYNYERFGIPRKRGNRYFFNKNDGLQNQSVMYVTGGLRGSPRMLLDPNTLSEDGTVALSGTAISEDGRYLAYGLSTAGSDWQEWKVRDVETGRDLPDHLKWVKFSGASWTTDGKGFFYSRYDEPTEGAELEQANYFQKLYFHKLGTPQAADELVYERKDQKEWMLLGFTTEDGRYLVIDVEEGSQRGNQVFYKDLQETNAPVVELLTGFETRYSFVGNDGPIFWFKTDLDAPRYRVIAIDTRNPDPSTWREVIPESPETLEGAGVIGEKFVTSYLKDAYTQVKIFDLTGKFVRNLELPGIGSAGGFGGRRDDTETFYAFTGFTDPGTIYRYDMASGKSEIFRRPKVDFNPDEYETEQVFYPSKDGTKIPMFLTYRKGLKRDGSNPTYLYGYGGFNVSLSPWFSTSSLVWMDMGGVLAVANIRGGGEYGKAWHEAAIKTKRQTAFDDFIAAGEWLIDHKYTSTSKLAIGGGSNGGTLVGACMTQRPDLFRACIPEVGVMDMLRFHKFTIGWAWVSDYGSVDNPDEFNTLYGYSPLHNIKPGTAYPATFVTTADHDDRVFPAHSFKFTAALQAAHTGPVPTIIRIQTRAGHGGGMPTTMRIEEAADKWAFLVRELGVKFDRG